MSKYILTTLLIFCQTSAIAVEPPMAETSEFAPFGNGVNIRQNHILNNIPLKKMPVLDRIQLYEEIQNAEEAIKKLNIKVDRKIFLDAIGFTEEEISYLKDVYDIYRQVQIEVTMSNVIHRDPARTTIQNGKRVTDVKWLYKRGYTFEMQEAANGKLETYEILWADQCWGRPLYLVKTPQAEEIIMQESQITNWQRKKD